MPSLADIPTTWPPPAPVVLSNSKDTLSAVKVVALRSIHLIGLAAFVEGAGIGSATPQDGRFSVWTHNAGTDRPLALLGVTNPTTIGRDDPLRGIQAALLTTPLDLVPDIYWIAVHLSTLAGQGKWNMRGLNTGGRSIIGAPAVYAAGTPATFPAGGVVGTQRLGIGAVGSVNPTSAALGAIVGTFIVGDGTLVGQGPAPQLNEPQLILNGKAFVTSVFTDFHQLAMGKPTLILGGKQATTFADSTMVPGKAQLLLQGKAVASVIPNIAYPGKAQLILNGKAVAYGSGGTPIVGKSSLVLTGKKFSASEVALLPTTPINISLVPTTPQTVDLVPTVERLGSMAPTVIESR
jgi:hypothetical protein